MADSWQLFHANHGLQHRKFFLKLFFFNFHLHQVTVTLLKLGTADLYVTISAIN